MLAEIVMRAERPRVLAAHVPIEAANNNAKASLML
jgi:hypothetical protein